MLVELNTEMVDEVVLQNLRQSREYLVEDLEKAKREEYTNVFSCDPVEDMEIMTKYIEAFDLIIDWYSPHGA